MDQKYIDRYSTMSDGELIDRILAKPCDGYAADYLILEKYSPLLRRIYNETYDAQKHDYFEDCTSELKIYLLGKDLSWKKLAGIEHKECISSWLETTSRRLFISIKPKLIDIVTDSTSIDEEDPEKPKIQIPVNFETLYDDQESMAVVIEAMATLTDNERFCFYMDVFKDYAHKDIAEMLRLKWEREGIKVKSNKKGVEYVTPDAGYVNVRIQRAKEKITKYYNKTYNIKITSWK